MASQSKPLIKVQRYEDVDSYELSEQRASDHIATGEGVEHEPGHHPSQQLGQMAVHQDRGKIALQCLVALVPVGISCFILQLSFRKVYWRGGGTSSNNPYPVNELLGWMQVAAKAHEILIVMSLSWLVLHYLRAQLVSTRGLPFGLFTAAYRVSMGTQPFSFVDFVQFGRAFKKMRMLSSLNTHWSSISLAALVFLASLLGLTSGPASANALIPKLDWWPTQNLFTFFQPLDTKGSQDFSMYIPTNLFPTVVDQSSLPGNFCTDAVLDTNFTCPYAGFHELLGTLNYVDLFSNSTIDSPIGRPISTRTQLQGQTFGSVSTWVANKVLASYLSLGFYQGSVEYTAVNELRYLGLSEGPYTVEVQPQLGIVLNPVVTVTCDSRAAKLFERDLTVIYHTFAQDPMQDGTFDVRDLWNETILSNSSQTLLEWREIRPKSEPAIPVLTAFMLFPSTRVDTANITICAATAKYSADKMWILSSGGQNIITDFSWDNNHTCKLGPNSTPAERRRSTSPGINPLMIHVANQFNHLADSIQITKEWADTLNVQNSKRNDANTTSLPPTLVQYLDTAMSMYRATDVSREFSWPAYGQSVMLSNAIADGLARIGSEYRVLGIPRPVVTICQHKVKWCGQGPYHDVPTGPQILNGSYNDWLDVYNTVRNGSGTDPVLNYIAAPADIETAWTQFSLPVKLNGYSWSFDGVTIKIATVILLLHALVILIHCVVLLYFGRSYDFAETLGALLSLALTSNSPAALKANSAGINEGRTWATRMALREVSRINDLEEDGDHEHLSIILSNSDSSNDREGGGALRKVRSGRRYH